MDMATLARWVRDPRSGEVHLPSEGVTIMGVIRNLLNPANYSDTSQWPKTRPNVVIQIFELSLYFAGLNSSYQALRGTRV